MANRKKPDLRADFIRCKTVNELLLTLANKRSIASRKKYGLEQFFGLDVLDPWNEEDRNTLFAKMKEYPGKHYPQTAEKLKALFVDFDKTVLQKLRPILQLPDKSMPEAQIKAHRDEILYLKLNDSVLQELVKDIDFTSACPVTVAKERYGVEIYISDNKMIVEGEKAQETLNWFLRTLEPWPAKGERFEGIIERVSDFGVFVDFGPNRVGLAHISNISCGEGKKLESGKIEQMIKEGNRAIARVLEYQGDRVRLAIDYVVLAEIKPGVEVII